MSERRKSFSHASGSVTCPNTFPFVAWWAVPVCLNCGVPVIALHILVECPLCGKDCLTFHLHGMLSNMLGDDRHRIGLAFWNSVALARDEMQKSFIYWFQLNFDVEGHSLISSLIVWYLRFAWWWKCGLRSSGLGHYVDRWSLKGSDDGALWSVIAFFFWHCPLSIF
jgi:hypothetical protein